MKGIDEAQIQDKPAFGRMLRLLQAGQLGEARATAFDLVARFPDHAEALYHLALLAAYPGHDWEQALALMAQAAALRPGWPEARYNAGYFAQRIGPHRLDLAEHWYNAALALEPALGAALVNLGTIHLGRGEHGEAIRLFTQASEAPCIEPLAAYNRGMARLLLGDWEHGWDDYEKRLGLWLFQSEIPPYPLWDGTPAPDKTLLIQADQGLGDTIMCLRWAPQLRTMFDRVIWRLQPSVLSLCPPEWEVQSTEDPWPAADLGLPIMSLPHRMKARPESISGLAYLPEWEQRVNAGLHVGLCWAGSPTHEGDAYRSLHGSAVPALFKACDQPKTQLVSLQAGPRATELPLKPLQSVSLRQTARLMRTLDLVITVDTVIAHLAGALGCPCWLMLPAHPDYRWLLQSERTPWYDSLRLYRQTQAGEWGDVFARITADLKGLIG
jgi:tetratricopeptide (TPR) repeat protein